MEDESVESRSRIKTNKEISRRSKKKDEPTV